MEASNPKPEMRILCFGDSLTEGYSNYGLSMTPYSTTLRTILKSNTRIKSKIHVFTDGVSGDRVVNGGFKDRMNEHYTTTTTASTPPYNYVLFLGGTNDLGFGLPAPSIFASIKAITALPLQHNSKVILFTVPECGVKNRDLDARRDELNRLIKADAEGEKDGRKGVYVFDLKSVMPYHGLSEGEREEIWDDGLHFTEKGYERMGEFVAGRLLEIIEGEKASE